MCRGVSRRQTHKYHPHIYNVFLSFLQLVHLTPSNRFAGKPEAAAADKKLKLLQVRQMAWLRARQKLVCTKSSIV
jgi:hypothetical protein